MFRPHRSALADAVVTSLLFKQKKVTFIETIVPKKAFNKNNVSSTYSKV